MTKKALIRIGIVILVTCVMCFSDWSFAAEWDNFNIMGIALNSIVAILSWIWIFFAKLAGTFLTNKWIYGEILWIDALLWKYWNVMKNIANFWLWFYFVYVIFKWLINQWKEDIIKNLKDIILWLLIAWIWIQASWFFTAAVVDVSTVTLAAVGSFPEQVISESPYVEWSLKMSMSEYLDSSRNYVEKGKEFKLFSKDWKSNSFIGSENVKLYHPEKVEDLISSLMPNPDDVSGPLYYLWFFIIKTNVLTSVNTSSEKWIKATILNTILQWWTTIIFALEMIVLCILALMRILYLWMFIILSPVAVLLWCIERCIEKSWQKIWGNGEWFLSKISEQIKFSSFFVNVFKPTIIVLWFWIAVLFASLMNRVVLDAWKKTIDFGWANITSIPGETAIDEWDKMYTISMDNNLVGFTLANAWKTFLDIILSIITVLLVYFILKFAVKFGGWKDFVSKGIWKVQDKVSDLMGSLPVMPVAWYDEKGAPTTHYINAANVFGLWSWKNLIVSEKIRTYQEKVTNRNNEDEEFVKSLFNKDDKTWYLSGQEQTKITGIIRDTSRNRWKALENTRNYIKEIATGEWKWMKLNGVSSSSQFWISQFEKWLTDMEGVTTTIQSSEELSHDDKKYWSDMIKRWNDNKNNPKRTLQTMFDKNSYWVGAYVRFFLEKEDPRIAKIKRWEDLKNLDISGEATSWDGEENQ